MSGGSRAVRRAALALLALSCSVEPVDVEGKECPCAPGYTCDPRTERCIIGNATGGSAGASGGSAGLPSGGSAGAAAGGVAGSAGAVSGGGGAGGTPVDASAGGTSSAGSSSGATGGTGAGGTGGTTASGGTGGTGGGKGSCVGHCDLIDTPVPGSKPACYCDDLCEGYGDCCSDKIAVCGKTPPDAGTQDSGGD